MSWSPPPAFPPVDAVDTRRPARLLHTSDVHLHRIGSREEAAFDAAVELALALDVDAVLVAGDLFDHARVPDEVLDRAADALDRLDRPVVLLNGNHDVHDANSVHDRFGVSGRCPNVLFLDDPDGTLVEVPGTDLVVWGRAMVEHEPAYQPLAGLPARRNDAWCVVAAHGLVVASAGTGRSSTISHEDLLIDWDYVALGHVHQHQVIRERPALACYPGATSSSSGGSPGVVVVELHPGQPPALEWHPLSLVTA